MREVIIASSEENIRSQLRSFLARSGISAGECKTAAQALGMCRATPSSIVICCRVSDMPPAAMARLLPAGADMILLISPAQEPLYGMSNVVCLTLPLNRPDFRRTVEELLRVGSDSRVETAAGRSTAEKEIIDKAKKLYMKVNGVSEHAAYTYIRKRSMNEGSRMADTARRLIEELALGG